MPSFDASLEPGSGVVVLGGTHSSLAIARSLGRAGVPVWLIVSGNPVTGFSRYVRKTLRWEGAGGPGALDFLKMAAHSHGLEGHVLIAAGDTEVRFAAEYHAELGKLFRMTLRPWPEVRECMDKARMSARALKLGLSVPRSHDIASLARAQEQAAHLDYPVVLKPGMRVVDNAFTFDKAWRADDGESFLRLYSRAAELVGAGNVMVQELVPGGMENQLSYAGVWQDGREIAHFTARRKRQYPLQFSHTSTYVESDEIADVAEAAQRFLSSVGHHGLCEVEFKRDPRTGVLKILDVNPRPWSWMALADAAGMPLATMLWDIGNGRTPQGVLPARNGVAWVYWPRDVLSSLLLMLRGELSPFSYVASLFRVRAWGIFSLVDPLPALLDLPIGIVRRLRRKISL